MKNEEEVRLRRVPFVFVGECNGCTASVGLTHAVALVSRFSTFSPRFDRLSVTRRLYMRNDYFGV